MEQSNAVQVHDGRDSITTVDMFDASKTTNALRLAAELAASNIIPERYQQKPANVLVALMRSARLGVDPFSYMETTYAVGGRTGHEAKFIVALINNSKKFKTPLLYRFEGETKRVPDGTIDPASDRKCTAYAILRESDIEVAQSVDLKMAFREGWATKAPKDARLSVKNNKWQSMTDEMLQYRAAAFFGKMYCPELTMGLNTRDELEDNISDGEAVEISETGKDIFEKGVPVDTAPEPIVDPANMVAAPAEVAVTKNANANPPPAAVVVTAEPVTVPPSAEMQVQQPEAAPAQPLQQPIAPTGDAEQPPATVDEFKPWFLHRHKTEEKELDVFLLSKKWLKMGETAADMPIGYFANILSKWSKFVESYEAFKAARRAAA
jgi:hypothetical protein